MWYKLENNEDSGRVARASAPMLGDQLEVTLSQVSIDVPSAILLSLKKKRKLVLSVTAGAVVIILLIVLVAANSGEEEPTESAQGHHLAVTSCGPVLGLAKDGGVEFRGIPYARSPIGDLRWEAAAPPSRLEHCWQGLLDYPPKKPSECLQLKHPTVTAKGKGSPPVTGSEDCLTLDVYTPRVGYDTPSQVVVVVAIPSLAGLWPGSSSQDSVTPSAKLAAQKNTVFVVPRFRLGPLGFLPRMLLNDTSTVIANGTGIQDWVSLSRKAHTRLERARNLGLTDVMAALSWVQMNIVHFGGDASTVTLLGWGAGASLVSALTVSKQSKRHSFLFTQVWLASLNDADAGDAPPDPDEAYSKGYRLWSSSACKVKGYDPMCLLSLPPKDLIKSTPSSWLRPGHPWLEPDGFWYRQEASRVWASAPDAASRRFNNDNNGATTFWDFPLTIGWSNCSGWRSSQRCPAQRLAQAANGAFSSGVFTYVTPCRNSNLPAAPAAAPADDVSAILGNMAAGADAPFVRNMQDLFYGFVRGGILQPGAVRASAGVYVVSDGAPIGIRSDEPNADCPQSAAAAADPVGKK